MFTKALRPGLAGLGLLLSLLALGPAAGSSLWTQQDKLVAPDGGADDNFGFSVALDGNTALVGAYRDTVGGNFETGSAYVYRWNGSQWIAPAKLTASDGQAGDLFGQAVAVSGTTVMVGARLGGTTDTGSVYVFRWDGNQWVEETALTASDGAEGDWFGNAVALSGNTVLVGAYTDDVGGKIDAGSAYVFRWDGDHLVEEAKLTASDGKAEDLFGTSVALSGDTIQVGAQRANPGGIQGAGAVYVYRWDGNQWVERAKLTASDAGIGDKFGYSVALNGEFAALVGAVQDNIGGIADLGSAYVFLWNGSQWVEQAKLTASDGQTKDQFGVSVDLGDKIALVGARLDDVSGNTDAGSAYVFRWDGAQWVEEANLTAGDGESIDYFGTAVALGDDSALVGALYNDVGMPTDAGAAYFYELTP